MRTQRKTNAGLVRKQGQLRREIEQLCEYLSLLSDSELAQQLIKELRPMLSAVATFDEVKIQAWHGRLEELAYAIANTMIDRDQERDLEVTAYGTTRTQ